MKTLLSIILFMSPLITLGQDKLAYTEVIPVEGVSQDDLYNRAKMWFTTTYNSANDVLQLDSKEEGQIIGKAVMDYNQSFLNGSDATKGYVRYTVKIFVKEGRYKYDITDFIHDPNQGKYNFGLLTTDEISPTQFKNTGKKWSNKVWVDIKDQVETQMNTLIPGLKLAMDKQVESKSDDW